MSKLREMLAQCTETAISLLRKLPQDSLEDEERAAIVRNSLLRPGAARTEVELIEQRLLIRVPNELKDLLEFSNGFLIPVLGTGPAEFLNASEIELYSERERATFDLWVKMISQFGFDADPDEDCGSSSIVFPSIQELAKAVALSSQQGYEILLMCPISDQSCGYLRLSIHTSTRKYDSLAMMLEEVMKDSMLSLRSRVDDLS